MLRTIPGLCSAVLTGDGSVEAERIMSLVWCRIQELGAWERDQAPSQEEFARHPRSSLFMAIWGVL